MTTIKLKNGSGAPTAGDLVQGEPALDLTNKRLYTEDSGGTVIEVGTNPGTNVTFADDLQAVFGSGSDLAIYHDSATGISHIRETGSGDLKIRASDVKIHDAADRISATFAINGAAALYHAGYSKLSTTSTGIDVTGTVTADGLTVDAALATINAPSNNADLVLTENGTNTDARIRNSNGILEIDADLNNEFSNSSMMFAVDGTDRLKIDNNGDISFYDSSGTSQSLFWDASAESLGIGTSSVDTTLHLSAGNIGPVLRLECTDTSHVTDQAVGVIEFEHNDATSVAGVPVKIGAYAENNHGSMGLRFYTGVGNTANEVVRFDHDGNVGIGTDSPSEKLHVAGALRIANNSADTYLGFGSNSDNYISTASGGATIFRELSTERMRIDSSGNLLVGTTSAFGTTGTTINQAGLIYSSADGDRAGQFDRTTNDGEIVRFTRAGSTVGSIGTANIDSITIGNSTGNLILYAGTVAPASTSAGGASDGVVDLGTSARRFKDLYLSGGAYLGGVASANLLDDYEEGTCDLTWSDGTNNSTVVTNKYTKVGRIVTVSGYVSGNVSGLTGTAVAKIAGFPFAFSDYGSFAVKLRYIDSPTGCIGIVGSHANSGSVAQLSFIIDNGNYVDVLVSDLSTNNNDTYFNITYTAT